VVFAAWLPRFSQSLNPPPPLRREIRPAARAMMIFAAFARHIATLSVSTGKARRGGETFRRLITKFAALTTVGGHRSPA